MKYWGLLFFFLPLGSIFSQKVTHSIPEAFGFSKYGFYSPNNIDLFIYSSGGLYHNQGKNWKNSFELLSGKPSSLHIRAIEKDRQGDYWIGYGNNCIQEIRGNKVQNFKPDPNSKNFELEQFLIKGSVNQIIAVDSLMLLASDYGLFVMSENFTFEDHFSFAASYPNVMHSFKTSDLIRVMKPVDKESNAYWVGGTMGLAKFDLYKKTWTHFPMPKELISESLKPHFNYKDYNNLMVTDILEISGKVYCATWGNGIMVYEIDSNKWTSFHYEPITDVVPLDENIVSRLAKINDSIFVATTLGHKYPLVFDFQNGQFIQFQQYFGYQPAYDFSDGVAVFGNQLWIGYFNSVEQYDISSWVNSPSINSRDKVTISKVIIDGKIMFEYSPFEPNVGLDQNFETEGKMIEIIFNQSPFLSGNIRASFNSKQGNITLNGSQIKYELSSGDNILYFKNEKEKKWHSFNISKSEKWFSSLLFRIFIAFFLIFNIFIFILLRNRKIARKKNEQLELKNKVLELEKKVLQSQINPHFVFNSLSTLKSLIIQGDKSFAVEYVNEFADFLRIILEFTTLESVNLVKEFEMLQKYVNLESTRFAQPIEIQLINDENVNLNDILIPPFVLQTFVENSIRHGILPHKISGLIQIVVANEKEGIRIKIIDNGLGLRPNKIESISRKSYGIELSKNRLNNFFEMPVTCEIYENVDTSGVTVSILLPKISLK